MPCHFSVGLWVAYSDVYRQTSDIFSMVHIVSHVHAYVVVFVEV